MADGTIFERKGIQTAAVLTTRAEPEQDYDLIKRAWSGPLDPIIPPGKKGFNSRFVIDATRPWEWRDKFPATSAISDRKIKLVARDASPAHSLSRL